MVKKKVCIKQYICTNLFLCFLVREMNSWPLMLILWYAGRRREDHPHPTPLSLWHTALSPRKTETETERWQGELGIQAEALSTLYFLWVESKVSLPGLIAPPSSFQPPLTSFLPHFLPSFLSGTVMSLLPPCCGVTDQQRLLLAASPVDSVVMSLTPGSTIGHPRPPQWAASLVYSVGEWGGEPRRDGETV